MLSIMGGNSSPSNTDITKILSSVGIDADSARIENLLSSIGNKDVFELIEAGRAKLASVPCGGAPAVSSAGSAAPASKKEEEKKKEEKEDSEEEEPSFDLFG